LNFDKKAIPPGSLENLEGFSHVWIIWVFHENTNDGTFLKVDKTGKQQKGSTFTAKVTPPRLGKKVGLFSTRSPHRPNPIGLSVCSLLEVNPQARTLRLSGVDLVNGTPILDVKPYIPYDSVSCSVPDWVEPPVDGDLCSGMQVDISDVAMENLCSIFNERSSKSTHLGVFGKRKEAFILCIQQVIAQDPRSILKKVEASKDPFNLVIDGLQVSFVAEDTRMVITGISIVDTKGEHHEPSSCTGDD
jgi:tRNA (adenine37-N6)-methyltransferase